MALVSPASTRSTLIGVIALVLAVAAGLVSVYSDSRLSCGVWVAVALLLAVPAGALLTPRQRS